MHKRFRTAQLTARRFQATATSAFQDTMSHRVEQSASEHQLKSITVLKSMCLTRHTAYAVNLKNTKQSLVRVQYVRHFSRTATCIVLNPMNVLNVTVVIIYLRQLHALHVRVSVVMQCQLHQIHV